MPNPTDCFYYLISRATLVATSVLRQELASAGAGSIRPAYLGVLLSLWDEDDLRSSALGRRAGLEPSSMTGLLDRMERDGLIRRDADPEDRRAQRIRLTPTGREIEPVVREVVDQMMTKVTGGLTDEELDVTKGALRKLLDLANRDRHAGGRS